jgi:glucosylceramidase
VKTDLGPLLRQYHPEVKIMIYDDQRLWMKSWIDTVLSDPEAAKYVDGIAFHWYELPYFFKYRKIAISL